MTTIDKRRGRGASGDPAPIQGTCPAGRSLAVTLSDAALRLWPRRAQQELLFDLGEHKPWRQEDRDRAIDDCATWLARELRLDVDPEAVPVDQPEAAVRARAEHLVRDEPLQRDSESVGRAVAAFAPLVGARPKTLANSLSKALRVDVPSHRWIRAFARLAEGDAPLGAWLYHRRQPADVSAFLTARAVSDVGDAMLVLSLLALWQRRRPTEDARGNLGRPARRRSTPMPIAGMAGSLIAPGQLAPLLAFSSRLPHVPGAALAALVIECALVEAHLAPHPSRRAAKGTSGEQWLSIVDAALTDPAIAHRLEDDAGLIAFRVGRMRAWRDRTPPAAVAARLEKHSYVAATLAIEAARDKRSWSPPPSDTCCMLLPQLRALGIVLG